MNGDTNSLNNNHHNDNPSKLLSSFKYAVSGLAHVLKNEQNFRIHLILAATSIIGGFFLKLSYIEWLVVIFLIAFVLVAELINSALEELMDHLIKERHEGVRIIKDVSAAAVFVSAFFSLVLAIIIFVPKLKNLLL